MVLYCYLPLPLCIIIQLGVIKADVIKHVLILDKRLVLIYNKEHKKISLENSLPTLFHSNTMTRVTIKVIFLNVPKICGCPLARKFITGVYTLVNRNKKNDNGVLKTL